MENAPEEVSGLSSTTDALPVVEWTTFKAYLEHVVPVLLDTNARDLDVQIMAHPETRDVLKRFLQDAQLPAIYFLKSRSRDDDQGESYTCSCYS